MSKKPSTQNTGGECLCPAWGPPGWGPPPGRGVATVEGVWPQVPVGVRDGSAAPPRSWAVSNKTKCSNHLSQTHGKTSYAVFIAALSVTAQNWNQP